MCNIQGTIGEHAIARTENKQKKHLSTYLCYAACKILSVSVRALEEKIFGEKYFSFLSLELNFFLFFKECWSIGTLYIVR